MWPLSVCFDLFVTVVPVAVLPYMEICMMISQKKQTHKPTNSVGIGFCEVVGDLCISMCVYSP